MRYAFTFAALAAIAATSLAAPVIDRRATEVLVFTETTTIMYASEFFFPSDLLSFKVEYLLEI